MGTAFAVSFFIMAACLAWPIATFAAATAPVLGEAANFSVLAKPTMTAANPTTISGFLGLSTGLAVTGTWLPVGHTEYLGPLTLAGTASADALKAFNNLAGQHSDGNLGAWGGAVSLLPGVYTEAADSNFTGTLTLNGGYDDVWVFQIGNDMTFSGSVILTGNAQACHVFWQVGNDATIASGSKFIGTLIAGNDITVVSGATVNGRILSLNGALTTDNNTISGPTCATAPTTSSTRYESTINVVKMVINDNGGTKTVADFPLFVNGKSVVSGVTNVFPAPALAYTVTETNSANYVRTFSGDCDVNGQISLSPGDNKVCIITNNDVGAPAITPVVPPLIDVVKVPSPLALPNGPGLVNYTYTLTNPGTVPVTDITMVGDTCSPILLYSGDMNGDAKLDVNETWVYRCATTLQETHTNTVVATGWANGLSATDIASATVVVGLPIVHPLIHVTKIPSPLTLLSKGGAVTYTEKITNPGTVALSNVNLTDDKCSPVKYLSGDINNNSKLENTETWTYTCKTTLAKTTTNTAVASGEANGFTVRDFAIATVVVASAVPKLPDTGISSQTGNSILAISILSGIIILTIISLAVMIFKRRKI